MDSNKLKEIVEKAQEAVSVVGEELAKLVKGGLSKEELMRAKEACKGHLVLAMEDSQEVADLFGEDLLIEGKIRTIKEIITGVEAVTVNQIQVLAKKLLANRNLNLTVLGPVDKREKFSKLLI